MVGRKSMFKKRAALLLFALFNMTSCTVVNPYFDATKKHHTTGGFINNYGAAGGKPLSELLRWQYEAYQNSDPKLPSAVYKGYAGFPVLKPDLPALKANCSDPAASKAARCNVVSVTWIGHATVLVQMGGLNILTDPHFSERTFAVQFAGPKRRVALPTTLAELPRIDLVVISHNHYDHLDTNTVKALQSQPGGPPIFAAPLGIDLWLKDQGVTRVERFDWWDTKKLLGVDVHFVPAQHWSSRSPFDRNATLWGGWVIKEIPSAADKGKSMFFAGDTGYSKDFLDIGARFGEFDIALIPVGAYLPRWFMKDQHVDPEEAVRIHQDVKAKWSMGVHWGTFELTDEALDQPILDLAKALDQLKVSKEDFVLFKHGQTRFFK
jgi:N-acyl-phosphatidylethanolamine-hydrolysing phospholipase D